MRRGMVRFVVIALWAALLVGATPITASAAPAAPTLTAPTPGQVVDTNPVLTWAAMSTAVKYDVQVSTDSTFPAPLVWSTTTANTMATPPTDLPIGTYWWRVRGVGSDNVAGDFATSTFVKISRAAPTPSTPADGQSLAYPGDALVFSWVGMAGAKGYEIQIDDDALFVGALAPIATANTSYTPLTPPVFNTPFFWRVRAKSANNVYSEWSAARSYSMQWDPAKAVTLLWPPSTNATSIEETVLDWAPLAGAAYYEIQVSPDANFNNPIVKGADNTRGRKVVATRFSDNDIETTNNLSLPAGAYYWRVRAMSTAVTAEPGAWSATWTFTKAWPGTNPDATARPRGYSGAAAPDGQVSLLTPVDGDATLKQPQLTWTPQRGAASYEVQFSTDANFSPANVGSCFTDHTRLAPFWRVTPNAQTTCRPRTTSTAQLIVTPGAVVYWRVRALDGPGTVLGEWTPGRSFLYDPANISMLTPANGATVTNPILSWTAVPNISLYKVTVTGVGTNCNSVTGFVFGTTWVPETLNPACVGHWDWVVQGVEDDNDSIVSTGGLTRLPLNGSFSFTWAPAAATASSPAPLTVSPLATYLAPLLSWPGVTGATKYRVFASPSGFNSYSLMSDTTATAYAYVGTSASLGRVLAAGDYDVFVRALDSGGATIADSPVSSFHVSPLQTATLTGPANCPPASCTALENDTPTFTWQPVAGAGLYIVYLATDPNFTNIIREFRTDFTSFTPAESLPDSQAGQATYWYVRPCVTTSACGAFDSSTFGLARAFRKISQPVVALSPTAGQVVTVGEVTFAWQDYLLANRAVGVTQEAAYYKVQVSNTANFTTILDTSPRVDATEYTADTETYPDGPLFWRVQAFDNTGNPLTFSAPIAFEKRLAAPTGLTPDTCPAPGCAPQTSSAPTLSWDPMAYSAQYEIEVYRSLDRTSAISPTNRVWSTTTRMPDAVPLTALAAGEYGWRVRRIDLNGNPGQWSSDGRPDSTQDSSLAHFAVGVTGPVLLTPVSGTVVRSNTLLLTWQPVTGATNYRVQVSTTNSFAVVLDTVRTDMTAWAPGLLSPLWPNAVLYWRVQALDANGATLSTSATWQLTRDAGTAGEFTAVAPFRVVDTRTLKLPIGANTARLVAVGGQGGVPASGVSAVVVNVTVTNSTAGGYLTVYPANVTRPLASNLNFAAGQTVPNLVTTGVDTSGRIYVYNAIGSVDVIVDVVGYYSNGALPRASRFVAGSGPVRIVDTRLSGGALGAGESRLIEVAGKAGVPANATAAVMNVTVVSPTAAGYVTVYPAGSAAPLASNLNFAPGDVIPNLVQVSLGTGGNVNAFNAVGSTDLVVDLIGWYVPADPVTGEPAAGAARFNAVTPARIFDSRVAPNTKLGTNETRVVPVRGLGGIPDDPGVIAVVANVTVTDPVGPGWLAVHPDPTVPLASNLNYVANQTVPNLVVARIGADGSVRVTDVASTHVLVDVVGWFQG